MRMGHSIDVIFVYTSLSSPIIGFFSQKYLSKASTPGFKNVFLKLGCLVRAMYFWETYGLPNKQASTKKQPII